MIPREDTRRERVTCLTCRYHPNDDGVRIIITHPSDGRGEHREVHRSTCPSLGALAVALAVSPPEESP